MAEKRSDKAKAKKSRTEKLKSKLPGLRKNEANKSNGDKSAKKKRRFNIFPGFLRNAWAEIRQVTWPSRKETIRLTFAVLIFSILFGGFIAGLDFGLDKLFKEVILR